MSMTLNIDHLIDEIPETGWQSTEAREKFIDAANELLGAGWRPERVETFLTNIYTAACEELS